MRTVIVRRHSPYRRYQQRLRLLSTTTMLQLVLLLLRDILPPRRSGLHVQSLLLTRDRGISRSSRPIHNALATTATRSRCRRFGSGLSTHPGIRARSTSSSGARPATPGASAAVRDEATSDPPASSEIFTERPASTSRSSHSLRRVVLKRSKQSLAFRNGNPLVFTRAILDQSNLPDLELGDLVEVVVEAPPSSSSATEKGRMSVETLGFGVYNPRSLYRVRILCHRYLHPALYRELQQINSGRHDLSKGDGFELGDSNSGIGVDPDDRGDPGSSHAVQTEGIAAILRHHFQVSLRKRLALGLPRSGMTDTFRWVNGEGDSLSGLAVDLLGLDDVDENSDDTASSIPTTDVASAVNDEETRQQRETKNATKPGNAGPVVVVMSSAGWCQIHQEIIVSALQLGLSPIAGNSVRVVWRTTSSRLAQDGYSDEENRDNGNLGNTKSPEVLQRWGSNGTVGSVEGPVSEGASASPPQNHVFSSLATTPVVVRENGVLYKVFPWSDGQKTSVYCDQRDNRIMLAELCRNKRVLDLCCYHGGFTLNAVLNGGATHCTAVDSSQDAIRALEANLVLNRLDKNKVEPVCSDITEFLQQSCHGRPDRQYDVVVLDPPKLAPTSSGLEKARRKYHGLNRDAIKVIDPGKGGLLLTCTCSAAMSQRDGGRYFLDMVSGAALSAGRCVTLLRVTGAAACHVQCPVAYPAGAYLTAALFYVHAA